jgi:hypothetical protein
MWRVCLRTPSLTQPRESADATSGYAKAGNGFPKLDDAKYTTSWDEISLKEDLDAPASIRREKTGDLRAEIDEMFIES